MYIESSILSATESSTENGVKTTIEVVKIENGYINKVEKRNVSTTGEYLSSEKEERSEKIYYSKENILTKDKEDDLDETNEEPKKESMSLAITKLLNRE